VIIGDSIIKLPAAGSWRWWRNSFNLLQVTRLPLPATE